MTMPLIWKITSLSSLERHLPMRKRMPSLNGNGTGEADRYFFDGTGGRHLLNTLAAALKSDDMLDLVVWPETSVP